MTDENDVAQQKLGDFFRHGFADRCAAGFNQSQRLPGLLHRLDAGGACLNVVSNFDKIIRG